MKPNKKHHLRRVMCTNGLELLILICPNSSLYFAQGRSDSIFLIATRNTCNHLVPAVLANEIGARCVMEATA